MLTLPEQLISPLVFIEFHVVLAFCFYLFHASLFFCILSFDCSFCLIAWYLYFLLFFFTHIQQEILDGSLSFKIEQGQVFRRDL